VPTTSDLRQKDPIVGTAGDEVCVIDARLLIHGTADDRQALVETVRDACTGTGFFYLENVFEESAVLTDVLQQMQLFFGLADNDPRKQAANIENKNGSRGWMPMFGEPSYQPGTVAYLESFDIGKERHDHDESLENGNVWPEIEGFRDDVVTYWDEISKIGQAVLEVIAEAIDLDRRFLVDRCDSEDLNTLRLLHYPENDAPAADANVGIAAHTDFECITLILQSAAGLELTDKKGNWYDAPGHQQRIVVLLDDMLERWTNGQIRATGHRVRNTSWERYSIVMFFAVNDDLVIEPLPQFVSDDELPGYTAVRQAMHIDREMVRSEKYRDATKTLAGK
jgi:isopenicillin N synthase-like dioxygenase